MLRFTVFLLLLANGAYFAWTRGHLAVLGLAPAVQTEPARMQAQIKPEQVRLLNPVEARRQETAATPAPASPSTTPMTKVAECLQSTLLGERQAQAVRSAAEALPSGTWLIEPVEESARWIVYMGKYTADDLMAKKQAEVRRLGVTIVPLQNPSLEPGISLGGYPTKAEANKELADLNKLGVRTAKVVQEKAAIQGQILRLPAVDDALRGRLDGVRSALGDATLRGCSPT
jgi:hypothetical protein